MKLNNQMIDREELRKSIQKLDDDEVFFMLMDAIPLLPESKLRKLAGQYINLTTVFRTVEAPREENLLRKVSAFKKKSLAGKYYKSFSVNSKNYREMSAGTEAWIAENRKLTDLCVQNANTGDPTEIGQAFEILFGLLDHMDNNPDEIIFFADEGGSWQVGVDWKNALPAYFTVLSKSAEPAEFARRIVTLLETHYKFDSFTMLATAKKIATPAQRIALKKAQ